MQHFPKVSLLPPAHVRSGCVTYWHRYPEALQVGQSLIHQKYFRSEWATTYLTITMQMTLRLNDNLERDCNRSINRGGQQTMKSQCSASITHIKMTNQPEMSLHKAVSSFYSKKCIITECLCVLEFSLYFSLKTKYW